MREKLSRLGRRLLQLEKETRYPAHPPSSPAEAYVADVGAWKCVWDGFCCGISLLFMPPILVNVVTILQAKCGAIHCGLASH